MAKGRNRKAGPREPNGRLQREDVTPTAELRRLRTMMVATARDAALGTPYGLMYLAKEIGEGEYEAAKRLDAATQAFHRAMRGPKGMVAMGMDIGRAGAPIDPDSEEGLAEARRDAQACERYASMMASLQMRGRAIREATCALIAGEYLDCQAQGWARVGLGQLADDMAGGRRK